MKVLFALAGFGAERCGQRRGGLRYYRSLAIQSHGPDTGGAQVYAYIAVVPLRAG